METNDIVKPSGVPLVFPDARISVYAAPKAACTSIKRTLASSYIDGSETERESLYALKRHRAETSSESGKGFLKIGFCRNPYDKILSIYTEKLIKRKTVKPLLVGLGFYKKMPFDKYIKLVTHTPDTLAEKHLKSQHFFLFRDGPPDVLIKFEDLVEGWKLVQQLFVKRGGKKINELQRLNTSDGIVKPDLTIQMKKQLAKRYRDDFELLGYEK